MITLLMAPELIHEIGDRPWIREATSAELEVFRADHPQLDHIDGSGRPYFAMAIDDTQCPNEVAERARKTLRMRWLEIH